MRVEFNSFNSSESLVENFAKEIIEKLQKGIEKKGYGVLFVSGGSTPKPLFEYLSRCEIDWENVKIGLVDERWVDENHADSNAKLVKENLLQNKAKSASFIPMYQEGKEANECTNFCSQFLKDNCSPCDVLILGMGDDAHTASLFPKNAKLKEALSTTECCISMTPEYAPHTRMSLSLYAILQAKNIYLYIQGKNKKEVYEKALGQDDYFISPISAVLQNDTKDIKVYYNE
jgi:6-phosphogluconolactonase